MSIKEVSDLGIVGEDLMQELKDLKEIAMDKWLVVDEWENQEHKQEVVDESILRIERLLTKLTLK